MKTLKIVETLKVLGSIVVVILVGIWVLYPIYTAISTHIPFQECEKELAFLLIGGIPAAIALFISLNTRYAKLALILLTLFVGWSLVSPFQSLNQSDLFGMGAYPYVEKSLYTLGSVWFAIIVTMLANLYLPKLNNN